MLSTFEQAGGAARSAHRLYRQLSRMGVDCSMLVQYRQSNDPLVSGPQGWLARTAGALRPYLDGLPLLCYRSRLSPPWSLAWLPKNIDAEVMAYSPDVIHLHGIGHGFLPISAISRLSAWPLVWTLHDSWAFTGGCHLPDTCDRYRIACGSCPQLNARHERDLSRWGWHRKAACWPQLDITFIAPSRWLARSAQASSLLSRCRIEVIPNGIDTAIFSTGDRLEARRALGLPLDRRLILFGANCALSDPNKGFDLLRGALHSLNGEKLQNAELVVFGDILSRTLPACGLPARNLGIIADDERLVLLYRAADLFVAPSRQENLPNMVMEAMACGTPSVAFDVGGLSDIITHGTTGYLAPPYEVGELAQGIMRLLGDESRRQAMADSGRRWIDDNLNMVRVAERYQALYRDILSARGGGH